MPQRGCGKRQRLVAQELVQDVEHVRHDAMFECEIASSLVQAWANCEMPACKVQFWAHKAYLTLNHTLETLGHTDRNIPESLRDLAAMGAWGRKPGNCARDLRQYLGQPSSAPAPEFVDLEVKILKPHPRIANVKVPFFFPHLAVSHMFAEDQHYFEEFRFGGSPDRLEEFWSEVESREDPRLAEHPRERRA